MLAPGIAFANAPADHFNLVGTWVAWAVLVVFVVAYALVVVEEKLHLRKSKPVLIGAGLIWGMIAAYLAIAGGYPEEAAKHAFEAVFLEFSQLFFFLIVAMAYVSAMTERNVFEALRAELISRGLSYRALFWITGVISFFLSAVLDNLTTALIMSAVVLACSAGNRRFIVPCFINLVIAANAGGAWSAFGDITTLMVWQAHKVEFFEFFALFVPSAVNFMVPAAIMSTAVPKGAPPISKDDADLRPGAIGVCLLFAGTIAITVASKQVFGMPAVFGMMFGLGLLSTYGYFIKRAEVRRAHGDPFNIFRIIGQAEWDTLLFFFGVLLCVGGLKSVGILALASEHLYAGWGHTWANVAMGTLSAVVDNIPIMYAVLQMSPPLDHGQWLLITLTCGVGGSMLSVGSAAGVALMGVSRGHYTFLSHLRWTWAVALGYIASVAVHLWWNAGHFTNGIWYAG
jgi:Na+/H+ antiporter NhaD/arsenite permease-like protein